MGMHQGVLAAAKPWPEMRAALEKHCGVLQDQGIIAPEQWLDLPQGEDVFHVASEDGRTYLLDPAMVLTTNPDLVVSLSGELGCIVASAGAETVSGTYWLVAAREGRLVRLYWQMRASLTEALDLGSKLPGENIVPLEDIDGKGLFSALNDLGFDPAMVTAPTAGQKYLWMTETLPASGDLSAQIKAHQDKFQRRDGGDWTKHIKPVPRAGGGFDLQYQPPSAKPSLVKRLFGR